MKKAPDRKADAELAAEYDFSAGVRGRHATRYSQGTNVVVLEADVAKMFPTAAAVNESLRALAGIIQRQKKAAATR